MTQEPSHNLLNQFIASHDLSLTNGVSCYSLLNRGKETQPGYTIVSDSRTHPLSLFTNSTKPEAVHNKLNEVRNKLLGNLRDKWNEADRPFVPRFYRTPESFKQLVSLHPMNQEPGLIKIIENRPVYNSYPIWSFDHDPLLSLILRVPSIFNYLITLDPVCRILFDHRDGSKNGSEGSRSRGSIDWFQLIEEREGQGPLLSIAFRHSRMVTVSDICPKVSTVIEFEKFEMIEPEITTVLSLDAMKDYDVIPPFAIIRPSENQPLPLEQLGFRLKAYIDSNGTLYERTVTQLLHIVPGAIKIGVSSGPIDPIQNAIIALYTLLPLENDINFEVNVTETLLGTVPIRCDGTYTSPIVNTTGRTSVGPNLSIIVPFREPMSCTSIEIEALKDTDFPIIAQAKLDGNRIIVHVIKDTVRYYSRNGMVQTAKFNEHFDPSVLAFASRLRAYHHGSKPMDQIQLDCEVYAHDVVHAEIGGWCNRMSISPEFCKLKLFLLSWLDLSSLSVVKMRGRDYTIGSGPFSSMLIETQLLYHVIDSESNLQLNQSYLICNRENLFELMNSKVEAGYEGLVLYPPDRPYTFANAGLKKIKKFYDGECTVLSYIESSTESGSIGSVIVSARASFDKDPSAPVITFAVNAALRDEVRSGSMTSARFTQCIGRDFTLICGSFSDIGIPIHARFKAPFGIESERLDHRSK